MSLGGVAHKFRRAPWVVRRQIRTGSPLRRAVLFAVWPVWEPILLLLDRVLPAFARRALRAVAFERPWRRSWSRAAYDPEFRDRLFRYILTFQYDYPIKPGDIVVQVGASFGEETERFVRAVGKRGTVVAIEPEAGNLERLRAKFSSPNVTIIPKAVSDRAGRMKLLVAGEREHRLADFTDARLTYRWWGETDELGEGRYSSADVVEVDTLDSLVGSLHLARIDFLLVETNGNELEVIKGAERVLSKALHVGARGHVMRDGVPIWQELSSHLESRGFQVRTTDEGMVVASRRGPRSS